MTFVPNIRLVRINIPDLDVVLSAYMNDAVEVYELETMVEAAVFGQAIELPAWYWDEDYKKRQRQVRFQDAPIRKAKYRSRPQHMRNASAVLKVMASENARDAYGPAQFMPGVRGARVR